MTDPASRHASQADCGDRIFGAKSLAGATGLTLHAGASGSPTASITLAGFSAADRASGKVTASFGHDTASGSDYLYVHVS